jgi:tight adherence protein C
VTAWVLVVAAVVLLVPTGPEPRRLVRPSRSDRRASAVVGLGGWARHLLGRPPDPTADRWWGWTAVATAVLLVRSPVAALATPLCVGGLLLIRRRVDRRRDRDALAAALPEVLELVAVAIRAGGTVRAAIVLAVERGPDVTAPTFRTVLARSAAGIPLLDALDEVAPSLGPAFRPLVSALVAAERDGAPLVDVVSQLAHDAHESRRRTAEARARQVPVRLLLPLVCCTLPAVLVVTIVPLAVVGSGLAG